MNKKRAEAPAPLSTLSSPRSSAPPPHATTFGARPRFLLAALLLLGPFAAAPPSAAAAAAAVRATQATTRPREAKAIPAGEVVVSLNEGLFNALLEAVFTLPNPPTFPLAGRGGAEGGGANCPSEISLAREMDGTRTAVRFQAGRIVAPVAFRGSYNAPLIGCLRFEGWADTNLNLSFDPSKQTLTARVEVKAVRLKKVPPLFGDGLTGLVQDALDARFNPVEILRAEQLSARLPMTKTGSGASLRLRATQVRHEVLPGELRLRIAYEFVREG